MEFKKNTLLEMSKSHSIWNLKSCWAIRSASEFLGNPADYILEHEVTVSGGPSRVEIVARFIHSISEYRARRGNLLRGGLVSLTIRRGRSGKRIDGKGVAKLVFRLKGRTISPQTRATISGNTSPVVAPLALSVSNPSIVSLVPASDQPCIEADVSLTTTNTTTPKLLELVKIERETSCLTQLPLDANAAQTSAWLRASRFNAFESTFASFSASDILRLSRDDLIQICGLADGIRLFNALHSKAPTPKLTLYFSLEGNGSLWRVAYLDSLTSSALMNKLLSTLSLPRDRLHSVLFLGPQGIHVLVTDELVANMKDESMYFVETVKDNASERYKLLLKPSLRT